MTCARCRGTILMPKPNWAASKLVTWRLWSRAGILRSHGLPSTSLSAEGPAATATSSLEGRLAELPTNLKDQACRLPAGSEREVLLRNARLAEKAPGMT